MLLAFRHENERKLAGIGVPSSRRGATVGPRHVVAAGGGGDWLLTLVSPTVEGCGRGGRRGGAKGEACARSQTEAKRPTKAAAGEAIEAWAAQGGLRNRSLDVSAHGESDRTTFRREVSRKLRSQHFAQPRLESAKARTASAGTGRAGDCRLAKPRVAADKKRPPPENSWVVWGWDNVWRPLFSAFCRFSAARHLNVGFFEVPND